ncbi:hypothetical protein FB45DRAFT_1109344 [Roridomyces roridus]|uniref:Uncharacterized protein n=1 Tax=Roridomyces roridus TaxID=1738132 RepID=A0AAD7FE82_9AGAR|nr:hypothetical protein FB45DRAFT_1109344 [Roridomyces roridus]
MIRLSSWTLLTAILAFQGVDAAFNYSMNIDVNSRSCASLSCGITATYVAGQIVAFDCVHASSNVINGSVWWARDPAKDFVPVGDMIGVDGFSVFPAPAWLEAAGLGLA